MIREKIAKYLRNVSLKKRRNLIEQSLLTVFLVYKKLRNILANSDNKTVSKLYLQARNFERNIIGGRYSFVTINELVMWTTEWIKSFSNTYDLIIGIPRSGLMVANLIALKLGKPLTTPELFVQGKYWKSDLINKKEEYKNILLVDDTISSGKTMEKSLQLLHSHCKNLNITKAALIATEESKALIDLYYKIIPHPRVFEWNLLHSKKGKLVSDLDGVICENCPPGVDLDEEQYIKWLKNAKPYLIPAFEIDVILSNRLEKYRSETQEWLAKHGVRYKELVLWNISSKKERAGKYAQHKIEILLKIKPDIVWESSFAEAKQIWEATKIPTLCIDEMILFS
jgi:adenine/guanine phosphoribosyltransferase-like PRPP-binding protein